MSYYPETIGAVSVSPKRQEEGEHKEEGEYEEEQEQEQEQKQEQEQEQEQKQELEENEGEEPLTTTTKANKILVRFAVFVCWLAVFHLASSTIVTAITGLIIDSAKCFGGVTGLALFVLPAAYAISPECVCNFKFRSLAPTIADGLFKLDYFVKRLVRTLCDKFGDKFKIK